MIRKIVKYLILILILYYLFGILVPFMVHPKAQVSEAGKKAVELVKQSKKETEKSQKEYVGEATIIETSKDALDARLQIIEEAKEKIVLSTFDIRAGKSAKDVFAFLLEAADRGVQVEILVDGMSVFTNMREETMFYVAGNHQNITIRTYNYPNLLKPWTLNGRMHDKYIIVDDQILLAGGRNTFDYFLGEYKLENLSFDREVLLYEEGENKGKQGTAIPQVMRYYEALIQEPMIKVVYDNVPKSKKEEELRQERQKLKEHYEKVCTQKAQLFSKDGTYRKEAVPIEETVFLTNPTNILAKKPVLYYDLLAMIENAKERVFIQTPYVVLSKDMERKLREVTKKDIPIAMEVNAIAVGDNVMASSDYLLRRKQVVDTGVLLYEFQGKHSSHGKSLLLDQEISVIGSFNFDMRSAYLDTETMFVIKGEEFQQKLAQHMEAMHDESIRVLENNQYEQQEKVEVAPLPTKKRRFYRVTSVLFQLIRYLI